MYTTSFVRLVTFVRAAIGIAMVMSLDASAGAQEAGAADLKANLDLPCSAVAAGEEEVEAPDIVIFYGQQYEGDGIFFCCDRSGSMSGAKFQRLQREVVRDIAQFSERVQFGIVFFDSSVVKFPQSGRPAEATAAMKASATSWVLAAKTGSASCYREALLTTLSFAVQSSARSRIVIALGDGMPSCPGYPSQTYGEETLAAVAQRNSSKIPIHAICIGPPQGVNEDWMRRLAAQSGGSYARIVE